MHSGRTHLLATGRQGKGQLRREGALAHATLAGKHEDDMAHGAQAGGNRSKVGVGPGGRSGAGGLVGAALAGGRAACLPTGSPGAVCKRGQGAAGWRMSCNAIELWPGKSHRDGCGNCANQHTFICVCGDFCRSCHRHRRELLRGEPLQGTRNGPSERVKCGSTRTLKGRAGCPGGGGTPPGARPPRPQGGREVWGGGASYAPWGVCGCATG